MSQKEPPQLQMIWPADRLSKPPEVVISEGYAIRIYQPGDEERFYEVMELAGWPGWNADRLGYSLSRILPDGWFMATKADNKNIVASAMCIHNYRELRPFWGDLGWLACDPQHTGKGLGYALSAAVTARFLDAGYTRIGLGTEHYRLAAIKTYLKVGYVPFIDQEDAYPIWQEICDTVHWIFTPDYWSKQYEILQLD